MAENTSTIGSTPRMIECQDSVTRPADTTQYAVGDAISDNATTATAAGAFTLNFQGRLGGAVTLTDFTLHKSDQDQTGADFFLLLFDALPAVAGWEDNAASAITDAEMKTCKGVVKFDADDWCNCGTGDIQTVSKTIGIVCAADSTTTYGILIAGGTYTPASAEVLTLTVKALQD